MNGIINILGRDVICIIRKKELLQDLIFLEANSLFFFKSWQQILQNEKGDHKWDALHIEVLSL